MNPTRVDVALDELRAALGDGAVSFSAGFGIGDDRASDDRAARRGGRGRRAADHVLVFLGLPGAAESEGFDRTAHGPAGQPAGLVEAVAERPRPADRRAGQRFGGADVDLATHAGAAILECWLGGQAAGGAAADLLTGAANPSGKLAETVPLRLEDNSSLLQLPG